MFFMFYYENEILYVFKHENYFVATHTEQVWSGGKVDSPAIGVMLVKVSFI